MQTKEAPQSFITTVLVLLLIVFIYTNIKQKKTIGFLKLYISELQAETKTELCVIYVNEGTKDEMCWVRENSNPKPIGTWDYRKHWWKWSVDANGVCRDADGNITQKPY